MKTAFPIIFLSTLVYLNFVPNAVVFRASWNASMKAAARAPRYESIDCVSSTKF